MEMVALITLCIGSALGLRFRVFVLLPAILITIVVITAGALTQGAGIGTIAVMNVIGAICLQFGYLGGVLLWSRTSAGRLDAAKETHPARPFTY
jgi:hypothetical protein